jgi:hypothetical protein
MGFLERPLSGRLDHATVVAVRALQERLQIQVDGAVGPVTKMRLYESLGHYRVPRLEERDEESG